MPRRDGFPGQRMRVIPAPLASRATNSGITADLLVTDCGFFPRAEGHGRRRPSGVPEAILMICADGRGHVVVGDERYDVATGQVALIPPGIPHEYGAGADAPWSLWWMHVRGRRVPDLIGRIDEVAGRPVFYVRSLNRIVPLLDSALRSLERGDSENHLRAAAGAAWHLLSTLPLEHQRRATRPDPAHLAQELLVSRLPNRTSVRELAALVGVSSSHLAILFRQSYGCGILEYQTRQRMAMACALLATTDRLISTVAQDVGYGDPYYFTRQFHHVHGMSPRDYRRSITRPT